ncbi:putative ATPase/DNA-binding SARP family transcriptional activator [Kibdelosporangium banguiense]|uniref:ATPase/DNA-binding SARP family transcriptional activator n=1 Tax=Kibdelosporangium banguiense TaxID=1365924 RepID=A0ABS4TGF5_9PSEU|nr:BTAD domain-containing putative transcriptional regulator [Kibdelosporangium banguiense]MBP2323504.1 putative ATPase/DNA-binding SARP family transcriptional activator [Kibdelosporangium banguiense]
MPENVEIHLLGPMEVIGPGGLVELHGGGQRTLIARLALPPGKTVTRATLIDALWADAGPPAAQKTLHSHLAHLRRQLRAAGLADLIATQDSGYALRAPADAVDAIRFETFSADGRNALAAGDPKTATELLQTALTMWRGEALADCRLGEWQSAETTRLNEARLATTEDLISARLTLGEHVTAVGELEFLVIQHPFRELLWELLILALYRSGRQADALAAFQRARVTLIDELGIEPGPKLRRLETAILTADPSIDQPVAPQADTTVTGQRFRGRLPVPLTRLVGRETDVATVRQSLLQRRLVTLTGPGGCGKTRLAVAIAAQYTKPVCFVDLAPLTESDLVPRAVADALSLSEQGGRSITDSLVDQLADQALLLLLDNCEHLVGTCARLAHVLLPNCPELQVLATSREPLHVPGETVHALRPLATPDPGATYSHRDLLHYDAVRLFLDRAQDAGAQIGTDRATAHEVALICARLDGLPLALELAAARAAALPVRQIAEHLHDRFHTLFSGSHAARPQHRALHTTIKWSYDLLNPDERALFRRLSVFAGSFGLASVTALWPHDDDAADLLGRLVEKSLVAKETGASRYRLLDTIHQFATAQLVGDELADARQRHAEFHLALAEQAEEHLDRVNAVEWLDRLATEHENLRAAIAWATAQPDPALALRLAGSLSRYCRLRGHYGDGRKWLADALDHGEQAPDALRAKAFAGAVTLTFLQCDYDAAVRLAEQSLDLYQSLGDVHGTASTRLLLGSICREHASYQQALDYHQSALETFQAMDDAPGIARALQLCAFTAWLRGDFDSAAEWARESLRRFEELGDTGSTASDLMHLGAVAHYRGDNTEALRLLIKSNALSEHNGCLEGIAWTLNLIGLVHHATGSAEARMLLERSLALHRELGDRWRMASVLEALAAIACDQHRWQDAARLLDEAGTLRTAINSPIPTCELPLYLRTRAALEAADERPITDLRVARRAK